MRILSIVLIILAFFGCHTKKPTAAAAPLPPLVEVSAAKVQTIPIFVPAFGHFVAYNSVEIKSQVEGALTQIHYTEGAMILEGEPVVTIDPRPYKAKLDLAVAERLQNVAQLNFAKEKVERYAGLVSDSYVSLLNFHEYQTQVASLTAEVEKNDSQIRLAEINLGYCYIRAPFSGLCGKKKVDIGNLITNNGDTLVTIKQLDPIYIDFSIPERDFFRLMQYQSTKDLTVNLHFPDYPDCDFIAELIVVNNEISSSTGMIPLRAIVKNPDRLFWPGQFIRTELILTKKPETVMVPISAMNSGQKGRYALVINDKGIAEMRMCEFGEILGDTIEVVSGISGGEKVVTNGQINVMPGKPVRIKGASQ